MYSNVIHRGTFREVPFNFIELGRKSGRKTIFHTYPNSNGVIAEDLGQAPIELTLKMIITNSSTNVFQDDQGWNYITRRNNLLIALEEQGSGQLNHPTFGILEVQTKGLYSINETINNFGRTEITATFVVVDKTQLYKSNEITQEEVDEQRKAIMEDMDAILGDSPTALKPLKGDAVALTSYTSALQAQLELAVADTMSWVQSNVLANIPLETLQSLYDAGKTAFSSLSEVYKIALGAYDNVLYYVTVAHNFAMVIPNTFKNVNEFMTDPLSRFDFFAGLFDFGNKDYREETTVYKTSTTSTTSTSAVKTNPDILYLDIGPSCTRVESLKSNQFILRQYYQSMSLAYAVGAVTAIEYKTEIELEEKYTIINNQFEIALGFAEGKNALTLDSGGNEINSTDVNAKYINNDIIQGLEELRVLFNALMDQKRENTFRIIDVDTQQTTLTTLTYQYFGNLNDYNLILTLNNIENPSLLTGTYKIPTLL